MLSAYLEEEPGGKSGNADGHEHSVPLLFHVHACPCAMTTWFPPSPSERRSSSTPFGGSRARKGWPRDACATCRSLHSPTLSASCYASAGGEENFEGEYASGERVNHRDHVASSWSRNSPSLKPRSASGHESASPKTCPLQVIEMGNARSRYPAPWPDTGGFECDFANFEKPRQSRRCEHNAASNGPDGNVSTPTLTTGVYTDVED